MTEVLTAETQKTEWVEADILPVLMDPSFGPNSVSEIIKRLGNKKIRKGWDIQPKDLIKYVTQTSLIKKTEPGKTLQFAINSTSKKEKGVKITPEILGVPNPMEILNCRIGIVQKVFEAELPIGNMVAHSTN